MEYQASYLFKSHVSPHKNSTNRLEKQDRVQSRVAPNRRIIATTVSGKQCTDAIENMSQQTQNRLESKQKKKLLS